MASEMFTGRRQVASLGDEDLTGPEQPAGSYQGGVCSRQQLRGTLGSQGLADRSPAESDKL